MAIWEVRDLFNGFSRDAFENGPLIIVGYRHADACVVGTDPGSARLPVNRIQRLPATTLTDSGRTGRRPVLAFIAIGCQQVMRLR